MKSNIILLLLLLTSIMLKAQSNKSGIINYQRTYYGDTLEFATITEEALLFNETEASYFYVKFIKSFRNPDLKVEATAPRVTQYNNFNNKIIISAIRTPTGYYLVQDDMAAITWRMLNQTKKIQNIDCFGAMAEYRGRVWTVWYAPSIPVSSGPWKLYGLPGMILEAEDLKGLIKYECSSIIIPPSRDLKIGKPTPIKQRNEVPISIKEFATLNEKEIVNAEKLHSRQDKDSGSGRLYQVYDIEIFAFEKNITLKRRQQKLSDIPKK